MKNWKKEFDKVFRRATTGIENIVGDKIVKDFIQELLDEKNQEIREIYESQRKIKQIITEENFRLGQESILNQLKDITKFYESRN